VVVRDAGFRFSPELAHGDKGGTDGGNYGDRLFHSQIPFLGT
jgi:hypothetical protein